MGSKGFHRLLLEISEEEGGRKGAMVVSQALERYFFTIPSWKDLKKQPGCTPLTIYDPVTLEWLRNLLAREEPDPQLLWLLITLFVYVLVPYDMEAARAGWTLDWIGPRLVVNLSVFFLYYTAISLVTYGLHVTKRKFTPNYIPTKGRLFHNVYYSSLGMLQYTFWEVLMVRMWAVGKVSYIKDEEAWSSPWNAFRMVFYTFALVPLFRGLHFYLAHRLLHFRFIYKYVHRLHHRNISVETFSGMAMHPAEHLYYLTCFTPSLVLLMSPFHFMWFGFHVCLSPALSHSGWEDHLGGDQFHYIHHQKGSCNYGSAEHSWDKMFGTFRASLGSENKVEISPDGVYRPKEKTLYRKDEPLRLRDALPETISDTVFFGFLLFVLYAFHATYARYGDFNAPPLAVLGISSLVAFGPILFCFFLYILTEDRYGWSWPFHKEKLSASLSHVLAALVFVILPVFLFVYRFFSPGLKI